MNLFQKIHALGFKKVFAILILAAIDVFVIAAPYYLKSLIPNLQTYLNVDEADISRMTAIIGWVTLLTQLPGGWLTDKFSSKKLLTLSAFITGLTTFWFGTLILKSNEISKEILRVNYYLIFAIWGISSTPLFWSPLWKLVSQQTSKTEQGFAYGLQGSFNGIIGIIFIFIVGTIVTTITANQTTANANISNFRYVVAFSVYIYIFATILCALGFLIYFFVIEKPTTEKFGIGPKQLFAAMSDWKVWALSFFLLGMYMFQSTFAYFLNQMLINIVGLPIIALTIIGGFRLYGLRFLISAWIGKWSDRLRSLTFALLICLLIGFILVVIFILLPGISSEKSIVIFKTYSKSYKIFVSVIMVILFFLTSFLSWIMVTLRYAQAAEIYRPKNSYGAIVAVMSFVGFSSDAWFYQLAAGIQDNNSFVNSTGNKITTQTGYQIIITVGIAISFIGLIAGFLVWFNNYLFMKKHNLKYYRWRDLNNA